MWIVKIGGSVNTDPHLPEWLNVLTQLGGGRVVLVGGGGRFADAVREHQAHWKFNDLAAHNMALLAMVQTAHFLQALNPALHMVSTDADAARVLRLGKTALWSPLALLTDQADAHTNWQVTSDSLALALAQRLGAAQLLVVKSCVVDPALSLAQLGDAGIVDRRFAALAEQGSVDIRFMRHDQPERARTLLLATPELSPSTP
jgi:5-(aminomethyl)-3-furanmethanol phosphate kinase